jgi:hypothetical protein
MKTATESGDAGNTFVAKQVEEVTRSLLLFQTTSVISTSEASFLGCVRNQRSQALRAKP